MEGKVFKSKGWMRNASQSVFPVLTEQGEPTGMRMSWLIGEATVSIPVGTNAALGIRFPNSLTEDQIQEFLALNEVM